MDASENTRMVLIGLFFAQSGILGIIKQYFILVSIFKTVHNLEFKPKFKEEFLFSLLYYYENFISKGILNIDCDVLGENKKSGEVVSELLNIQKELYEIVAQLLGGVNLRADALGYTK